MNGLFIKEILADIAADDMLVNDPLHVLGLYLRIEAALGIYDHDRTECAETEASGLNDKYIVNVLCLQLILECSNYLPGTRRSTACTSADQDLLAVAGLFSQLYALFLNYFSYLYEVLVFGFYFVKICNCHYLSAPPLT